METHLADWIAHTSQGEEAKAILQRCVHCGFCTATCPTYQVLGDELDGPRGRIYLMKQMLEGGETGPETMLHLDRCLTCRSCETTCPSGVEYGRLLDIGRHAAETRIRRPVGQRLMRGLLREGLTSPLLGPAVKLGRALRPLLPGAIQSKIPLTRPRGELPTRAHARRVLLLAGCVQPAMMPGIDGATQRVLDRLGISSMVAAGSGCCGAIRQHLADPDGAKEQARMNVDAWWPMVASGEVEAIVVNASGCTVMVKDYAHLLQDDVEYAPRAQRITELVKDPIELLEPLTDEIRKKVLAKSNTRVAYHAPCTQQHGLRIRGTVERLLVALGAQSLAVSDSHLCCGSAGTYSLLQPALSTTLRDRKLEALQAESPSVILSANVGCIAHLAGAAKVPVMHWLEWLDERLALEAEDA
ncbi:MAG: glycolate oxidase iron-sulfur subunit [Betaproteobacteria bacterium]|nr:glycolate oxidase iron-sulfur subunit [Betaproteobacteria bacterium]